MTPIRPQDTRRDKGARTTSGPHWGARVGDCEWGRATWKVDWGVGMAFGSVWCVEVLTWSLGFPIVLPKAGGPGFALSTCGPALPRHRQYTCRDVGSAWLAWWLVPSLATLLLYMPCDRRQLFSVRETGKEEIIPTIVFNALLTVTEWCLFWHCMPR